MWGVIVGVAGWIWGAAQTAIDAIVIALQWAAGALKTAVLGAWQAVRFTWNDIVKPIGRFIDDAFQRVKALYTNIIKPSLDWLKRVTHAIRSVYDSVLRPILNTIDRVRQVLQLLELLHVPFAAKLDAELADLERKLALPLQLVIRALNGLTNRVESYVLTAENLFQRVTHLNTIARDLKAIQNLHWAGWTEGLSTAARAKPPAPAPLAPATDHAATLTSVLNGNFDDAGVDMQPAIDELNRALAA